MTVRTSIAALQALHATIPGIVSTPTTFPASIDSSSLPLVLVWPEAAAWERKMASAPSRQDRTYLVQVFVAPAGSDLNDAVQPLIDLLQAFGDTYTNPENIALANGAYQVTLKTGTGNMSDEGAGVLMYAGNDYHGFQFRINVSEHSQTT